MQVVILAGGLGTRLSEETVRIPKPMVTIGDQPILWHIMKIFAQSGFTDFIIPVGYKGDFVRNWVQGLHMTQSSFRYEAASERVIGLSDQPERRWTVTVLETGRDTQTSGRLRMALEASTTDRILMTYGDGLADVNLNALLTFHEQHGHLATVTAVRPPARFGRLGLQGNKVEAFGEKVADSEDFINGGFFVLQSEVLKYLTDLSEPFEASPLERLAADGELMAYVHDGFWQPMDTARDRQVLEDLWASPTPPWKNW